MNEAISQPMIDSTSPLDRASRATALSGDSSNAGTARVLRPRDSLQTDKSEQLSSALGAQPEVRPEMVARGQALAADPNYPGPAILTSVARMIVNSPDPSEDQS